jgi:hypothetical protein
MKRETIERLAIDVAAGELNEDAEALFNAYLAEHPQAKEWAEQMSTTYENTQEAIAEKTSWANTTAGTTFVGKKLTGWVRWRSVGRWAAVVVLSIVIGFAAGRWGTTDETTEVALSEPEQGLTPVKTASDLKEKYAGTFWGDKMLALLEHKPAQQYKADLHSVSLWDKYRLYKKESRYE